MALQLFMVRKGIDKHKSHVLIIVADDNRVHWAEILHAIRLSVAAWPSQKNCPTSITNMWNLAHCAAIDNTMWLRKEITYSSGGKAQRHAILNSLLIRLPVPTIIDIDNTNPAVLAHCAICNVHQRVEPNELLISHGMLGYLFQRKLVRRLGKQRIDKVIVIDLISVGEVQ